jgi:RNA polymerase sigma-70 factor (ECF subfamily)
MNDNELINRCQNGDKAAFEKLLNRHYDTIYRFAYRWCGDQHNAQDITQLACIKLARALAQFEFKATFTSWLYRLVINCAKDYYKSPQQHNVREESNEHINPQAQSKDDRTPQRLYAQQILQHINTLQEDLRDTLILVHGQGLSHSDVAKQLNVKESTVSWRIHEARKQLRQTFSSSGYDTEDLSMRGSV